MNGIDNVTGSSSIARLSTTTAGSVSSAKAVPAVEEAAPVANASGADLLSVLADAAPPVDTKKVEAIRSLIATGAYPIDSHAIAAKMVAMDFPAKND